jgi:hypothetical protein
MILKYNFKKLLLFNYIEILELFLTLYYFISFFSLILIFWLM